MSHNHPIVEDIMHLNMEVRIHPLLEFDYTWMECFSYEGGCGVRISRQSKKCWLAWAMNNYFQFINNVMLITLVSLSYQRIKPF